MWLDRFSGQSSPAGSPPPHGRSYSPAPKRPSHLGPGHVGGRPAFSPRSSSLSLPLNASTTSLSATSRQANGSPSKQLRSAIPDQRVSDPIQTLEQIIGGPLKPRIEQSLQNKTGRPEDIDNVEFGDLSLQDIASGAAGLPGESHVPPNHRPRTAEEYEREKEKFEDLHSSIVACDDVLKSVETYLTSFQTDLGAVSSEIESLQNRSVALNTRLENRKTVETLLGPAVEDISISPAIVKKLSEGTIDEAWVKALNDIERRYKIVEARSKINSNIKAVNDAQPILQSLIDKALERIRDFIVAQIKALRSPNINAQIIQQQKFLRYKELYSVLSRHHPQLSEEVGQAYINTMRWYYHNHFTRYESALGKVKLYIIDKTEVLGQDDISRKGNVLNNRTAGPPHDAFSIGRRTDLLRSSNRMALSSYLAEEDKSTHYLEVPFRNFNVALVDNATAEYSFLTEFFSTNSFHQVSRKFQEIFEPTFAIGQTLTKSLIDSSVDCLGILLCVRLNQHFAFELQRHKVPTLDSYINGTNMLLWPRFQIVMDMHCESVKKVASASGGRSAVSALSLTTSDSSKQSAAPHFLTQRFAQLLQGILVLSSEAGDDEPVSNSVNRLGNEFESFLSKVSKGISESRKRSRFLFNNYSLILTIIEDTNGKLADEQKERFGELKKASSDV